MHERAPINQARLDEAFEDIHRYITDPEDLRHALKQLHSITEYAPGDEHVCTWVAALDSCEQVKGYFPNTTPEPVLKNIDQIADDIRRLRKQDTPAYGNALTNPRLLIGIVALVVALWGLSQCVPRG